MSKAAEFINQNWVSVFRSALLLASIMVILDHFYILEWLDVFMLHLHEPAKTSKKKPAQALVFTIEQVLFETEFESRTPIHRSVLKTYLEELLKVYGKESFPNFKVLAIDYDLSPNYLEGNHKEQEDQRELDDFLMSLHKDRGIQVVLIKHLPVASHELCELKRNWEKEKYDKGLWFGNSELLQYGIFGTIVKYAEREDSFPAVALTAVNRGKAPCMCFTCDDERPLLYKYVEYKTTEPINYSQANAIGAVQRCPLYGRGAFQGCKDHFGAAVNHVKVIFFGGDYGSDDTYFTPLGDDTPGVIIHAYTYFSMLHRLEQTTLEKILEQMKHWLAWGIDIIAGFIAGLILHGIWHKFHRYHEDRKLVQQVALIFLNVVVLILFFTGLVWLIRPFDALGIWINPAPMFIGLCIHGYIATATATVKRVTPDTQGSQVCTSLLYKLFGGPNNDPSGWALLTHILLKIVAFWITVGMAACMLWASH